MYKNGTGEPELFDSEDVPKSGYADSPKGALGNTKPAAKKAAAKPSTKKRARKDGKFVADDPTTPDINEAYVSGKAPAKKKAGRPKKKASKK